MTNTKLLSQLTNTNAKEVLQYKPSHVSNRVRLLFTDNDNQVFESTLNDSYDALFDERVYNANQIKNVANVDVEDVKDLFRENAVTANSCVATRKVGNYNDHFKLWGIDDVKSLIGHVSTDRACVSSYYTVVDAELIYDGQILKVTYSTDNDSDITEEVLYTDYMPVDEKTEDDAPKAVVARNLFGADKSSDIINYGHFASIKTEEELKALPALQQAHYGRYGEYYVLIHDLNTLPNGATIKAMIDRMIDAKDIYNSKFCADNGIHQGHLSEMRSGKRDVNRMILSNVMNYLDGFKY